MGLIDRILAAFRRPRPPLDEAEIARRMELGLREAAKWDTARAEPETVESQGRHPELR